MVRAFYRPRCFRYGINAELHTSAPVTMTKYLNPKNYLRRAAWIMNQYGVQHLESLIAPDPDEPLRHPPIFFLGAPRSGSTLMVQVMTDALGLGYISNRHCQWFGAPALAERVFHPLANKPQSDYHSTQGATKGYSAPSECGQWWYRFFRRNPPYVTLDEVDPAKMRAFRRSVAALTQAFDRPVVFKNLYASLRIQAIAKYLPESLFVITHRDEIQNGHSLLEARFQRFNDYQPWLSVEPPEVEKLKKLPPHEQVIEQIRHIHAAIDVDLRGACVPYGRVFHVNYEEFCETPHAILGKLSLFLESNQCFVKRLGVPPHQFKCRQEIRIDRNLYSELRRYAGDI